MSVVNITEDNLKDLIKKAYDAGFDAGYANMGDYDEWFEDEYIEQLILDLSE